MEEFYHFSHFFEFLCGVYFGGFALLGFLEEDALKRFEALLQSRTNRVSTSRILSEEYFQVHTTSPVNGRLKYGFFGTCWFIYSLSEMVANFLFSVANFFITKIGTSKDKEFLKKFFPAFFFTGCFCLVIVFISAFQLENKNILCYNSINHFMVYYALSCIIFSAWSLIIFPLLVNKVDYFHLTLSNLLFSIGLAILSFVYCKNQVVFFHLDWFLVDIGKEWLKVVVVIIALLPLLFILIISIITLLFWEFSAIFYSVSLKLFANGKKDVSNDIEEIVN